jgi:hypothetical protein
MALFEPHDAHERIAGTAREFRLPFFAEEVYLASGQWYS